MYAENFVCSSVISPVGIEAFALLVQSSGEDDVGDDKQEWSQEQWKTKHSSSYPCSQIDDRVNHIKKKKKIQRNAVQSKRHE